MKLHKAIYAAMLTTLVACGGYYDNKKTPADGQETTQTEKKSAQPLFSIFENTGRDGIQIYRNTERLGTLFLENDRKIIDMRAYKTDCYILLSNWQNDTIEMPAEIYKNGRPAMIFEPAFKATAFCMQEAHFYVLGTLNGATTVYRDGQKALNIHAADSKTAKLIGIQNQDIYIAFQCDDNTVEITKNGKHHFNIDGKLQDFKVSPKGLFTLASNTLYLNDGKIMNNKEYHRYADKEMYATPMQISANSQNWFVCCQSTFNHSQYYACVFRDRDMMTTVKPDSKPIGQSPMQTRCAAVAATNTGVYIASYKTDSIANPMQPYTYQFMLNNNEAFSMDFGENNAKLLFMDSSTL